MKPIVYRLEDEYRDRMDFRAYDTAGSPVEMKKYKYIGQPQFVLVDAQGRIVQIRNGYQTYESLKADIDAVLSAPAP